MVRENFGGPAGRPERRKARVDQLKAALGEIAGAVNREAEREHGLKALLNADCSIAMEGFAEESGGIYPAVSVEEDKAEVHTLEWDFTGADNPQTREFYRTEFRAVTEDQVIEKWRQNKEKDKSSQTEMAVTILLHKMLGRDFVVARTAAWDDYRGGVDNVILDKRTGAVVCAFDEIHEDRIGKRLADKREKVKKIVARGGARMRYGIAMEDGRLKRSRLDNLPMFYLSLGDADLENLLVGIGDGLESVSPAEEQVLGKLLGSLREQVEMLNGWEETPSRVKAKLAQFIRSLDTVTAPGTKK